MSEINVLHLSHHHPEIRAGGAVYVAELYDAMRRSPEVEPLLLSRTGPPLSRTGRHHQGTSVSAVAGDDPNQYLFHSDHVRFDEFLGATGSKGEVASSLREFISAHEPEVVHFHRTPLVGYETIREVRNVLPDAPVVYSLQDYGPICHRDGLLLRAMDDRRCSEESPRRCNECFPALAPREFFLRKRFIQSHLALVDVFLAPTEFLRQRYLDWGIPPERIRVEEPGRTPFTDRDSSERSERRRLGYFGSLDEFKGVNVLLRAAERLVREGVRFELWIHGANLDLASQGFQTQFESLLSRMAEEHVTYEGEFGRGELSALMTRIDWVVVPSIWWEASSPVIQEAFMAHRPVICSDIGAMAEQVTDRADGLHFRAGDPHSLAETIRAAVEAPELWESLRRGVRRPRTMEQHVDSLCNLYRDLIDARREGTLSMRPPGHVPGA